MSRFAPKIFFLFGFLIYPMEVLSQEPVVGSIFIDRSNVFDPTFPDQRQQFYRIVNHLHIVTKKSIVEQELLFESGDPFDPKLLEESERNLRVLGIFRDVSIFPLPERDGVIDVVVHTEDAWSTEPQLNIGGTSENRELEMGLVEKNLFGYAKTVSFVFQDQTERESVEFHYFDPRLRGSRYRLELEYETRTDGFSLLGGVDRPFYSLRTPWAFRVSGIGLDQTDVLYESGDAVSSFDHSVHQFSGSYGHKIAQQGDVYHRLFFSYLYRDDDFTETSSTDPDLFPEDRRFSQFALSYRRIEDGFLKTNYINAFEREEDFNLGNVFTLSMGYSPKLLGGDRDRQFFSLSDSQGYKFDQRHFIRGAFSVSGRYTAGKIEDTIQRAVVNYYYYWEWLLRQTLALHFEEMMTWNLDKDSQLLLGGDTGLRGYPQRQFTGNKLMLFSLEDRLFFIEDFLHIVSPGAVIFFDSGFVWPEGEGFDLRDFRSDAGFGFRLGVTRSSTVHVIRIDFAWALDPIAGEPGFVFSFGSSQSF